METIDILGLLRKGAISGDPYAQFELGVALDYGNGVKHDPASAARWYLKSAQQGHSAAENNLLLLHVLGQVSLKSAKHVYSRLCALAKSGDAAVLCNLGLCYQHAIGTKQNYVQAARCFKRAAKAGLATAQFNLGGLYYEGNGFRKSIKKAVHWYSLAAQQRDELALLKLGQMYQHGEGVECDGRRALMLYLCAYTQGSTRAANHLAFLFRKGIGTERDDATAYSLYMQSVRESDTAPTFENRSYVAAAYFHIGAMAESGEGTECDLSSAIEWYTKGAALGQKDCAAALKRLKVRQLN